MEGLTVIQQEALPLELRQILAELELLSHGTTANLAPTGAASDGEGDGCPPGERWPPHLKWREQWEGATDDDGRRAVLRGARAELHALTHRAEVKVRGETEAELEERIVKDGAGWSVEEVATRMRCTPTFVRKARLKDGKSIKTGEDPASARPVAAVQPTTSEQRERIRRLAHLECSERTIAAQVGVSKSTVRRIMGKAA